MEQEKEQLKYLVRIAQTDLDGKKPIGYSLLKIKGVGFSLSNAVCNLANVDKNQKTGSLTEQEIKKMDEIIKNPYKYKIPIWLFNRRKDIESGKDMHLITTDLIFAKENDIKRMKRIKSYRGIRHSLGLPVRGQRTKSNFREKKGKVKLGVVKRATAKPGRV